MLRPAAIDFGSFPSQGRRTIPLASLSSKTHGTPAVKDRCMYNILKDSSTNPTLAEALQHAVIEKLAKVLRETLKP